MESKLTQGNIVKSLLVFTTPLILSDMFQQIFNWVDAFIVGNTEGELALAGIGATTSLYNFFVTIIIGFTSGLSVLAAQLFGKGEGEKLKSILFSFSGVLGGIFLTAAVLASLFTNEILVLLDTPANIFDAAKQYMQLLLIGIPFLAIYNLYSAVLRGLGNSRAPFLSVLICSGINVFLDILFVMVFRFGTAGAAAATAISQAAMAIFIVLYAVRKYPVLRFGLKQQLCNKAILLQGIKFGFPPAIQAGMTSVGNIVLQRFMNGFGEQTVAAITTSYRVDSVILLPIVNFGSGIATIVAQNIGAGNKDRAQKVLKTGIIMMAVISICLTFLVLLTGKNLIEMFGLTQESVQIGKSFFNAIASCYIIYGLAMAVRGYLEGTGDMLFSGVVGIIGLMIRIIASYTFAFRFGNMVIAYAEMLSWIALLFLYCVRFLTKKNSRKKKPSVVSH